MVVERAILHMFLTHLAFSAAFLLSIGFSRKTTFRRILTLFYVVLRANGVQNGVQKFSMGFKADALQALYINGLRDSNFFNGVQRPLHGVIRGHAMLVSFSM